MVAHCHAELYVLCLAAAFTLKTLTDALATAQSFPEALETLGDTWANGLTNVGSDIVNNLVAPLGLSDELQALENVLKTIGSTFSPGTGEPTRRSSAVCMTAQV